MWSARHSDECRTEEQTALLWCLLPRPKWAQRLRMICLGIGIQLESGISVTVFGLGDLISKSSTVWYACTELIPDWTVWFIHTTCRRPFTACMLVSVCLHLYNADTRGNVSEQSKSVLYIIKPKQRDIRRRRFKGEGFFVCLFYEFWNSFTHLFNK